MLALERRNLILEKLQIEKRVLVSELSSRFEVSEETIRRDLEKLEQDGFVTKTYGGAVLCENNYIDMPFVVRKNTNVAEKQTIAKIVSTLISDGDHIMMDNSSTAMFIARFLKNKNNLTLITNEIGTILEISDVSGWDVICTGGNMREGTLSLLGPQAQKGFSAYHVDWAIISCKGIELGAGFTDSNEETAFLKQIILSGARKTILAIDHTKFDKAALARIATVDKITHLITDAKPSEEWLAYLAQKEVECLYPKE